MAMFLPVFTLNIPEAQAAPACGSGKNAYLLSVGSPVGSRQFAVACTEHDACYDILGKSKGECDKAFHNRMLGICSRDHNTWFGKGLKIACNGRADAFYSAVNRLGQSAYDKAQTASAPAPVPQGEIQKPSQPTTTLPPQVSQVPSDSSSIVVLQSDSGKYLGRCNNCIPDGAYPDSAFVHVSPTDVGESPWSHFAMKKLSNGNYAFQSDSGKYLGRCNNCVPGGAYPDSAFVHVLQKDLMKSPWAQFTVKKLSNGNYVLQSDNGKYLSRCNACVPGAANPDSVFMQSPENSLAESPWFQWKITTLR